MIQTKEQAIEKFNGYVKELEKLAEVMEDNLYTLDWREAPTKRCSQTGTYEYRHRGHQSAYEDGGSAYDAFKKLLLDFECDEDLGEDAGFIDMAEFDRVLTEWNEKGKRYRGFAE